jgi:hypothetical protein
MFLGRSAAYTVTTGTYNVAMGWAAGSDLTTGHYNVYLGTANVSQKADSVHSIAMGCGAAITADHQLVVGGYMAFDGQGGITDGYFGNGVTCTAPGAFTFHATGGSGTDIAGANLTLAGGQGTGTGVGGYVELQTAPASGVGGTTPNTAVGRLRVTTTGDLGIVATKKFCFDGLAATGDTYIVESSANVLDAYVGNTNVLKLETTGVTGTTLRTAQGSTGSIATATPTTIFAAATYGHYFMSMYTADLGTAYIATASIINDGTNTMVHNLVKGANCNISASGANIQVTQSSGGNAAVIWTMIRFR